MRHSWKHDFFKGLVPYFALCKLHTLFSKDRGGSSRDYGHYHIPAVFREHHLIFCCPFLSLASFRIMGGEWRASWVETDTDPKITAWRMPRTCRCHSSHLQWPREKSQWNNENFAKKSSLKSLEATWWLHGGESLLSAAAPEINRQRWVFSNPSSQIFH